MSRSRNIWSKKSEWPAFPVPVSTMMRVTAPIRCASPSARRSRRWPPGKPASRDSTLSLLPFHQFEHRQGHGFYAGADGWLRDRPEEGRVQRRERHAGLFAAGNAVHVYGADRKHEGRNFVTLEGELAEVFAAHNRWLLHNIAGAESAL